MCYPENGRLLYDACARHNIPKQPVKYRILKINAYVHSTKKHARFDICKRHLLRKGGFLKFRLGEGKGHFFDTRVRVLNQNRSSCMGVISI